jgi:hypothetical protein
MLSLKMISNSMMKSSNLCLLKQIAAVAGSLLCVIFIPWQIKEWAVRMPIANGVIEKTTMPPHPHNRKNQVFVLRDITPPPDNRRHMFCAALWQEETGVYLALAGNRPAHSGMTSYRLNKDGSVIPSSEQLISDFSSWEDPRLLQMADGVILAFMQYMGRPFAVARWFTGKNTIGPISELRLQLDVSTIVNEATKNWSPFVYDGMLHFLISAFPTIVVRCETLDNLHWDVCTPLAPLPPLSRLQDFQSAMILRGGSNFEPYPPGEGRNIFVGFLHTRLACNGSYLHVPVLHVIMRSEDDKWHSIYTSAAPSFTVGHNISEFLQSLVNHHIQDPVSLAKFDNGTGDVYVTLNMADDNGRCALGLYKNLLPPTILAHASNNWILQAAKLYETYNSTKDKDDSIASLSRMCAERYG